MNNEIDSIKSQEINENHSEKIDSNVILREIDSDEISISQLEMMANKKKLAKKSEEISVSEIMESEKSKNSTKGKSKGKSKSKKDNYSENTQSSMSESIHEYREKDRQRHVKRENNDEYTRKQKSEFLYKFNKINANGKWSSLELNMNNSLEEIQNEYTRIHSEIQNERSVAFLKRMMLLGVQGIEMMNTKFDPLGMDLDGWSEAMGYSMENMEYDEVLSELYEKYKGRGQMSPEVKLIFMIISSATMFTVSKKIAKLDSTNMLKSLLGSVVSQQPKQQRQQTVNIPNNQPQQYYSPPPQQNYSDNDTETEEDDLPSKFQRPIVENEDQINIQNILRTMNERKKEQFMEENLSENENTEDIIRNIPISTQKRGRGRPKKTISVNRV
jgi:hypothetical protein